ncbi:hypothetical protein PQX77_021655 [Marasmius sp. AFHP31]|nr:hypothetical protein PQX77_021655 [Marasmius sp. AFHP31]
MVKPPPKGLDFPTNYSHPGISGLQKHRAQRHLANASPPPAPARAVTPPLDPSTSVTRPSDLSTSDESVWDPTFEQETPCTSAAPAPPVEWWKDHHPSQHEYYELESSEADEVLFQVKLSGVVPDLKGHKYTYNEKSVWHNIHFFSYATRRTLSIDWQRLKGRIPPEMVIHPNRPTKNTNLPLMVMRGDLKGQVVTKVAGVATELFVLPVVASTGHVDVTASPTKVLCVDCCVVRLRAAAQKRWITRPSDLSTSDESVWDPTFEQETSCTSAAPAPPVEWWKDHHPSQHEYYELESSEADEVLFQVKLSSVVPDLKGHKYTYNEKSVWHNIHFFSYATRRTLSIDWQRLKGRIPPEMVIHPNRPTKNTNLPLMVMRGDLKGQVVTKVAGVATELFVLPVVASTGHVDVTASPTKVLCVDCCVVWLRAAAQKRWSQFKVKEWEREKNAAAGTAST